MAVTERAAVFIDFITDVRRVKPVFRMISELGTALGDLATRAGVAMHFAADAATEFRLRIARTTAIVAGILHTLAGSFRRLAWSVTWAILTMLGMFFQMRLLIGYVWTPLQRMIATWKDWERAIDRVVDLMVRIAMGGRDVGAILSALDIGMGDLMMTAIDFSSRIAELELALMMLGFAFIRGMVDPMRTGVEGFWEAVRELMDIFEELGRGFGRFLVGVLRWVVEWWRENQDIIREFAEEFRRLFVGLARTLTFFMRVFQAFASGLAGAIDILDHIFRIFGISIKSVAEMVRGLAGIFGVMIPLSERFAELLERTESPLVAVGMALGSFVVVLHALPPLLVMTQFLLSILVATLLGLNYILAALARGVGVLAVLFWHWAGGTEILNAVAKKLGLTQASVGAILKALQKVKAEDIVTTAGQTKTTFSLVGSLKALIDSLFYTIYVIPYKTALMAKDTVVTLKNIGAQIGLSHSLRLVSADMAMNAAMIKHMTVTKWAWLGSIWAVIKGIFALNISLAVLKTKLIGCLIFLGKFIAVAIAVVVISLLLIGAIRRAGVFFAWLGERIVDLIDKVWFLKLGFIALVTFWEHVVRPAVEALGRVFRTLGEGIKGVFEWLWWWAFGGSFWVDFLKRMEEDTQKTLGRIREMFTRERLALGRLEAVMRHEIIGGAGGHSPAVIEQHIDLDLTIGEIVTEVGVEELVDMAAKALRDRLIRDLRFRM